MGELKSGILRREGGFYSYIRSTEVRVKIPVNIYKIPVPILFHLSSAALRQGSGHLRTDHPRQSK